MTLGAFPDGAQPRENTPEWRYPDDLHPAAVTTIRHRLAILALAVGFAGASLGATAGAAAAGSASPFVPAGDLLGSLSSYTFRLSLSGPIARPAPIAGSRLIVTGDVVRGTGFSMRFTGRAGTTPVSYLQRDSRAWLGIARGGWLSIVPPDPGRSGSFPFFLPSTYYNAIDRQWAEGAKLVGTELVNGVSADHWRVDPKLLIAQAGDLGFVGARSWSLDMWVAHSGGWLVRAAFRGTIGQGASTEAFSQQLDITRPNARVSLPSPH